MSISTQCGRRGGRDSLSLSRALPYVDLNPVRAKIVEQAVDYEWSSAQAHVTGRDPAKLLDLVFGASYVR